MAGCDLVAFKLVGQAPGAVELTAFDVHAFYRGINDLYKVRSISNLL